MDRSGFRPGTVFEVREEGGFEGEEAGGEGGVFGGRKGQLVCVCECVCESWGVRELACVS